MRVVVDASFASQQHSGADVLLGVAWIVGLAVTVAVVLRRAIGTSQ